MSESFDSSSKGLSCDPFGRLDVHGMKRLMSVLDVKTNRIDHSVSTSKRIGDGPLIVNIGLDKAKLRIIMAEQRVTAIRMP